MGTDPHAEDDRGGIDAGRAARRRNAIIWTLIAIVIAIVIKVFLKRL
jgi:t-SNARE complex subunit (syntaxin)